MITQYFKESIAYIVKKSIEYRVKKEREKEKRRNVINL